MTKVASSADLSSLPSEELMRRRGDLGYAAQMAALEGLAADEGAAAEFLALGAELSRRGIEPHAGPAKPEPRR